jgi:hypothetical protein
MWRCKNDKSYNDELTKIVNSATYRTVEKFKANDIYKFINRLHLNTKIIF